MSVPMMDNEGPFARAARSLETVTGETKPFSARIYKDHGTPIPVDLRTECEELRAQLTMARAAVVALLGALNSPEDFALSEWEDWNGEPIGDLFTVVMSTFGITENEVVGAAEDREEAFRDDCNERRDDRGQ